MPIRVIGRNFRLFILQRLAAHEICSLLLVCFSVIPTALFAGSLQISDVGHKPIQPHSATPVSISAQIAGPAATVVLEYQLVDPGRYIDLKDPAFQKNWLSISMSQGKGLKGTFSATLAPDMQVHRRLVRYRIKARDVEGTSEVAPDPKDTVPNFAYFVYDGIPGWGGAIEPQSRDAKRSQTVLFGSNAMQRVQAYHLISKKSSIENVTWREQAGGKEYRYTGTLVSDGIVYDHVRMRARGGSWRYAMGKNMWKFDFHKGHLFQARDDFGIPYRAKWGKVNLRSCIQQGDYGMRGEQGMFESVGFRLFNLAGVESPRTHWIQLRIIDEAEESPANQYEGDFWGLYLAIENEDGHFLKEHGMVDGNIYKMEGGSGSLSHQGEGASTNRSDLDRFLFSYNSRQLPEQWWRTNLDLPRYYSYRAIIECIHHYDVSDGKNYDYYLNPKTGLWSVIPWDMDLTWADHMFGSGDEPFKHRVLSIPMFRIEYQNRLREIRDLLFNTNQSWQVIDECALIIADPSGAASIVDADRIKWDFHPVMAMGGKAGQGLFYRASPNRDFAGMVQLMKQYVKRRCAWIDVNLLEDRLAPPALTITADNGSAGLSTGLTFHCSPYKGANAFVAMKWRLGAVSKRPINSRLLAPNPYEIVPVWESPEVKTFSNAIAVPAGVTKPGYWYRARVRVKDSTGRWSHWSAPVEFAPGA